MKPTRTLIILFTFSALTGCTTIGPQTIPRDRFDYADAISSSWRRQTLLNMVKLRYADVPVFLDVVSIIGQYSLEGQVDLGASWSNGVNGDVQNIGVAGKYSDRPTITYQPLVGREFTENLMTPLRPESIFHLIQSGWPFDRVFSITTQSINGLSNRSGTRFQVTPGDPEFLDVINRITRVQKSGKIGMRMKKTPEGNSVVMFFERNADEETLAEIAEIKKILGLAQDAQEYRIVYGATPWDDREIAVLSRSMLEIMLEMALWIDVPEQHLAEGRATLPLPASEDWSVPMVVHSGKDAPKDSFVAVRYRDYWFWIDDKDLRSKRSFTFLMIMFTLTETSEREAAPIVTVPTG